MEHRSTYSVTVFEKKSFFVWRCCTWFLHQNEALFAKKCGEAIINTLWLFCRLRTLSVVSWVRRRGEKYKARGWVGRGDSVSCYYSGPLFIHKWAKEAIGSYYESVFSLPRQEVHSKNYSATASPQNTVASSEFWVKQKSHLDFLLLFMWNISINISLEDRLTGYYRLTEKFCFPSFLSLSLCFSGGYTNNIFC